MCGRVHTKEKQWSGYARPVGGGGGGKLASSLRVVVLAIRVLSHGVCLSILPPLSKDYSLCPTVFWQSYNF